MTTDAQGSRVVLTADGSEPDRLSDLVHQVAYLNTREFPSPGKRIVQLATTLHCKYVLSTKKNYTRCFRVVADLETPKDICSGKLQMNILSIYHVMLPCTKRYVFRISHQSS